MTFSITRTITLSHILSHLIFHLIHTNSLGTVFEHVHRWWYFHKIARNILFSVFMIVTVILFLLPILLFVVDYVFFLIQVHL
jgi:hypothetical protein